MNTVFMVVGLYCSEEGEFQHNVAAYSDKATAQNIADALDELANTIMLRDGEAAANKLMLALVPGYKKANDQYGVTIGTSYYVEEYDVG